MFAKGSGKYYNKYELLDTFPAHAFDIETVADDYRKCLDEEGDDREIVALTVKWRVRREAKKCNQLDEATPDRSP